MENQESLYRNEKWLREMYIEKGLTTFAISSLCLCSDTTVGKWLKKFGIQTRGRGAWAYFDVGDIIGQKFDKLTVLKFSHKKPRKGKDSGFLYYYVCRANDGRITVVERNKIKNHQGKLCYGLKPGNTIDVNDIVGKKFHALTVLNFSHKRKDKKGQNLYYYKCRCDCSQESIVLRSSLKLGRTKSCGCLNREPTVYKPLGEASFHALFNSYKRNAKNKNRKFSLTKDEFRNITQKNCHYCGIVPKQEYNGIKKDGHPKFHGSYIYNGIDKIDPNKDYSVKNSVPCCFTCNIAKHTMSIQEFIDWIQSVYKHSIHKE